MEILSERKRKRITIASGDDDLNDDSETDTNLNEEIAQIRREKKGDKYKTQKVGGCCRGAYAARLPCSLVLDREFTRLCAIL